MREEFTIVASACPHATNDIQDGYRSIDRAIRDTFRADFPAWDMWLMLGDFCGSQDAPADWEGWEISGQLFSQGSEIRHKIYTLAGNHDRELTTDNSLAWFRKHIDPIGENTATSGVTRAHLKYPVDGTAVRYKIEVPGTNLIILMMSDMNRPVTGMHGMPGYGGDPAGVVLQETVDWWKAQCELYRNTDKLVITGHHYPLKDTVVCSGFYEGATYDAYGNRVSKYHGPGKDLWRYSGMLAYVGESEDDTQFTDHLIAHPGDTRLWINGQSHVPPGTKTGGKGLIEYSPAMGMWTANVAGMTGHHGKLQYQYPRSRPITFTHGSSLVSIDNYHHVNKDPWEKGFRAGTVVDLGKPFIKYE